jgi:hypothetical protein
MAQYIKKKGKEMIPDTCENCGYKCTYDDFCDCWTCDSCQVTFDEDHPRVEEVAKGFYFTNSYCKECYESKSHD